MTLAYDTSVGHSVLLSVRLHPEIKARCMARAFSETTDLSAVVKKFLARYAAGFTGEIESKTATSDEKKLSEEVISKKKERNFSSSPSGEAVALARLLVSFILRNNPKHRPITEATVMRWARVADLTHGRDGRSWEEMNEMVAACQNDHFWWRNILSMEKFREKYDQLEVKVPKNGRRTVEAGIQPEPGAKGNPEAAARDWLELHATCPGCQQCTEAKTVLSKRGYLIAEGK